MERPIIFSGPMVQAILEGRKTMTRRVIKPQPEWRTAPENALISDGWSWSKGGTKLEAWPNEDEFMKELAKHCPYGKPGDTLWARETWCKLWDLDGDDQIIEGTEKYYYRAGAEPSYGMYLKDDGTHTENCPWKPSIHMPRKTARLFLTVKDVRVERLQDITEEDARAEGVKDPYDYQQPEYYEQSHMRGLEINKSAFAGLWDSINAKRGYGWDTNPFCWVIEFERKV